MPIKSRDLDDFSRLAHDMRSCLTSVKEGIALVSDGTLGKISAQQKKCLKIAEEGIAKVVGLIESIRRLRKRQE